MHCINIGIGSGGPGRGGWGVGGLSPLTFVNKITSMLINLFEKRDHGDKGCDNPSVLQCIKIVISNVTYVHVCTYFCPYVHVTYLCTWPGVYWLLGTRTYASYYICTCY